MLSNRWKKQLESFISKSIVKDQRNPEARNTPNRNLTAASYALQQAQRREQTDTKYASARQIVEGPISIKIFHYFVSGKASVGSVEKLGSTDPTVTYAAHPRCHQGRLTQ